MNEPFEDLVQRLIEKQEREVENLRDQLKKVQESLRNLHEQRAFDLRRTNLDQAIQEIEKAIEFESDRCGVDAYGFQASSWERDRLEVIRRDLYDRQKLDKWRQ